VKTIDDDRRGNIVFNTLLYHSHSIVPAGFDVTSYTT